MNAQSTIDGQGASEKPQPQGQVGGKQVGKLSEAFSYKPPVVVPFENKHYQVFIDGLDTRGTFTSSQMAKVGEDVKQLEYSIEYQFVPEKKNPGTKPNDPAYISVHLLARVTDLASERHADFTGVTNPQKAAQEANKARLQELEQFTHSEGSIHILADKVSYQPANHDPIHTWPIINGKVIIISQDYVKDRIAQLTADNEQA